MQLEISQEAKIFGNIWEAWRFINESDVKKWVDQNLGKALLGAEWRMIFKEAANRIWVWRNQEKYSLDWSNRPTMLKVQEIMYRV